MDFSVVERRLLEKLRDAVAESLGRDPGSMGVSVDLMPTKDPAHGHLFTPVAMQVARLSTKKPVELAQEITERLKDNVSDAGIATVEVKGPGFINFFLADKEVRSYLLSITEADLKGLEGFLGGTAYDVPTLLEYVSANPTGPLSIAHARQAAVGDSLARIFRFAGIPVQTEFYVNDIGNQINLLGLSLKERCKEALGLSWSIPEGGYKGEYIEEIALQFIKENQITAENIDGISLERYARYAKEYILDIIKRELEDFNVTFDNYYSQEEMEKAGKVEDAFDFLKAKGLLYEKDNAVWVRTTQFGDDKDRVVVKSDGTRTYFSADIAYHIDKFNRGFEKLIDILGPDHHGYIPRLKSIAGATGKPLESIHVIIVQLATLFRNGQPVPMSTRQGQYITIDELVNEVGRDAARFFLLLRRTNSHLDFDMDLAKKSAPENPVYYLQYAHARCAGIIKAAKEKGIDFNTAKDAQHLELLNTKEERMLIYTLMRFTTYLVQCVKDYDPYPLTDYLRKLAADFHQFYERNRVVGDNLEQSKARLCLVICVKNILKYGLMLLGITAPDSM